ncbi:MAG: hypothetical protein ACK4GO_14365 [Gemmobacter sp.]
MTMTKEQPATGLRLTSEKDRSLEAVRARIALFCERFNVPVPKLKTRHGAVLLTDELHEWLGEHRASYDWILFGDALPMAAEYRDSLAYLSRFTDANISGNSLETVAPSVVRLQTPVGSLHIIADPFAHLCPGILGALNRVSRFATKGAQVVKHRTTGQRLDHLDQPHGLN